MKRKTSVTLSEDILQQLERVAGAGASRSGYIDRLLRRHFRKRERMLVERRDLKRINAAAARLNAETEDVLDYQSSWPDDAPG